MGALKFIKTAATKAKAGGTLRRVVGSTDARGQGTEFPIGDVGHFILFDDARGLEGPGHPPFGRHPHAGLVACSYVPAGGAWHGTSSIEGDDGVHFGAGDVVILDAGRFVAHEEVTVGEGDHELVQCILRLPAERRNWNPTVSKDEATEVGDGFVQVFDGPAGLDCGLVHLTLEPDALMLLSVPKSRTLGFAYVRSGVLKLGERALGPHEVVEFEGGDGEIALKADGETEAFIGTSALVDEDWVKLLGHNGFVVAPTLEEAEESLALFDAQ